MYNLLHHPMETRAFKYSLYFFLLIGPIGTFLFSQTLFADAADAVGGAIVSGVESVGTGVADLSVKLF